MVQISYCTYTCGVSDYPTYVCTITYVSGVGRWFGTGVQCLRSRTECERRVDPAHFCLVNHTHFWHLWCCWQQILGCIKEEKRSLYYVMTRRQAWLRWESISLWAIHFMCHCVMCLVWWHSVGARQHPAHLWFLRHCMCVILLSEENTLNSLFSWSSLLSSIFIIHCTLRLAVSSLYFFTVFFHYFFTVFLHCVSLL